jgi:HSP20 family protein
MENIMANITRFDPFTTQLNDLFGGLFLRPVHFNSGAAGGELAMKIDVKQDDNAYSVTAEIPGARKEDIQVDVDGNLVSISAEVRKEMEDKEGERTLRSERYYGKLARTFTLEHEIDEAAVDAKYENGVLKLTLPKKAKSSVKTIPVH